MKMTFKKACEILGISKEDSLEDIKRKYYKLAQEAHPDSEKYKEMTRQIDFVQLNDAYMYLVKQGEFLKQKDVYFRKEAEKIRDVRNKKNAAAKKNDTEQTITWNAPINPGAYVERNIYQNVQDLDGSVIGTFVAARGKYFWNPQMEEFSLFMRSIMKEVNQLIEEQCEKAGSEIPENSRFQMQKELVYLLAGQYTDIESGLQCFSKETTDDCDHKKVYAISANLELQRAGLYDSFQQGENLIPIRMRDHRLYIGKLSGNVMGYLSFPDDRLYYVLIPMFENREVQVKIQVVKEESTARIRKNAIPLRLFVRRIHNKSGIQADINQKIEKILTNS